MQHLSEEYIILFNAITDAKKALNSIQARLILAQQIAEESFVNRDDSAGLT